MQKALEVIRLVSSETDRVILFHSASGKDSIALLNLMAPCFREIVCVYMYLVKDLSHINRYLNYATSKYPNARFVQVPYYGLGSYIKTGYMGCKQNPAQKKFTMTDITEGIRQKYGIQWAFFGFKGTGYITLTDRAVVMEQQLPPNAQAITTLLRHYSPDWRKDEEEADSEFGWNATDDLPVWKWIELEMTKGKDENQIENDEEEIKYLLEINNGHLPRHNYSHICKEIKEKYKDYFKELENYETD